MSLVCRPGWKGELVCYGECPSGAENYTLETISNCRKHIITKLNRLLGTDIDSLIEVEEVLDPAGIEK